MSKKALILWSGYLPKLEQDLFGYVAKTVNNFGIHDDLVNEALLKTWLLCCSNKIDMSKNASGYIYIAAKNCIKDQLKKHNRWAREEYLDLDDEKHLESLVIEDEQIEHFNILF